MVVPRCNVGAVAVSAVRARPIAAASAWDTEPRVGRFAALCAVEPPPARAAPRSQQACAGALAALRTGA